MQDVSSLSTEGLEIFTTECGILYYFELELKKLPVRGGEENIPWNLRGWCPCNSISCTADLRLGGKGGPGSFQGQHRLARLSRVRYGLVLECLPWKQCANRWEDNINLYVGNQESPGCDAVSPVEPLKCDQKELTLGNCFRRWRAEFYLLYSHPVFKKRYYLWRVKLEVLEYQKWYITWL